MHRNLTWAFDGYSYDLNDIETENDMLCKEVNRNVALSFTIWVNIIGEFLRGLLHFLQPFMEVIKCVVVIKSMANAVM